MSVPAAILSHLFTRKLSAVAGYTFLLYDYVLTLPLEVAYFWNAPWTIVKVLFLVNRYWNLIGQMFILLEETGHLSHHSEKFCVAFTLYLPFFVILSGESIRLLIVMRACAILGCKRAIIVVWNTLYVLYAMAILGVVLYFFTHAGPLHFQYLAETGVCITPAPPKLWTILFITLVLDSFIVVIVYYSLHHMIKGPRGIQPSRLVRILARDAILFYFATLFNSFFCIVCWTVYSQDPRNVLQQLTSIPFLSVMGQRLVLNLRRLRTKQNSTRDFSEVVNRQIVEMQIADEEQTEPRSDSGLELGFPEGEWSLG